MNQLQPTTATAAFSAFLSPLHLFFLSPLFIHSTASYFLSFFEKKRSIAHTQFLVARSMLSVVAAVRLDVLWTNA
jgi:hypothetical protein